MFDYHLVRPSYKTSCILNVYSSNVITFVCHLSPTCDLLLRKSCVKSFSSCQLRSMHYSEKFTIDLALGLICIHLNITPSGVQIYFLKCLFFSLKLSQLANYFLGLCLMSNDNVSWKFLVQLYFWASLSLFE